ncbi:hypothetical protein [Streptomyces sp. NPDC056144]|uniref:hypothetical protein n=1 Tax=unclassified Streptomyces TaxID=2593676 RepID=UPI0035DC1B57
MRPVLTRLGAVAVFAGVLVGCSGEDAPAGAEGRAAAEVCDGFAAAPAATEALRLLGGGERFRDDLSEPGKALTLLREASRAPLADAYRPQAQPYCWLLAAERAEDAEKSVRVELRPVKAAPSADSRRADEVTAYASGLRAYADDDLGKVFFSCRLPAPAHPFVVETAVWGPDGATTDDGPGTRTRLITLANAAAGHVAAELGCADTGLAEGVPVPQKA